MESPTSQITTDSQPHTRSTLPKIMAYAIFFLLYTLGIGVGSIWIYKFITTNTPTNSLSQLKPAISSTPDLQTQVSSDELTRTKQWFTEDILEKNTDIKNQFVTGTIKKIITSRDLLHPFYFVEVGDDATTNTKIYVVTNDYSKNIYAASTGFLSRAEIFYNRAVVEIISGQNISTFMLIDRTSGDIIKFSDPHALLSANPKFSDIKQQMDTKGFFEAEFISHATLFGNKMYLFQNCGYCTENRREYATFIIDAQIGTLIAIEPYTTDSLY